MSMHETGLPAAPQTFVSFRILSEDLVPEDITRALEITPHAAHQKGDPRRKPKFAPYRTGLWSIDSGLPPESDLETHLNALLQVLESKTTILLELSRSIKLDFYATLFDIGGVDLSTDMMSRMAKLGASFGVTIYPGREELLDH
jgi:hypothetical protein